MADIFISYSREDQATARRFAGALAKEGFTVWWDQALNAGETFDKVTERALREAKAVVVLWSKHSVESRWVRSEATQADRFGTLVPVTIEPCERPIMFELTHTAELPGWNGDLGDTRWRSFVEGLRHLLKRGASPADIAATSAATADAPHGHRLRWVAYALGAVVLGGVLLWYFQGHKLKSPTAAPVTARSASTATASVAVLPFRDMSQNHDQEYFADGVTEEILNTLSGIPDLKVTARTSAFAFKDKDVDLRTVGETLGVQHILEGSIRKDGEQLRITAQLIDARTDAHLWSRTYDRGTKDIFKVQEDIARSVAEALQVSLGVGFASQLGMTRDVQAYEAYLASLPLTWHFTTESQRRIIVLLEQATARDPGFADAWARLAEAYGAMRAAVPTDADVWQQKADAALETTRRLTPDLPRLHYMLGQQSIAGNRWSEAAGHYQRVSIAASGTRAHLWTELAQARPLLRVGHAREALAIMEQERARDPLSASKALYLGVSYSTVENFPAAIAEFRRGYPLATSERYIFWRATLANALAIGDRSEIRRLLDSRPMGGTLELAQIETRFASMLDRPEDALRELKQQSQDPSTPGVSQAPLAQWLAYFGDQEAAIDALRRGFEGGAAGNVAFSLWYPITRKARVLPEFKQLVSDFGFVDYWNTYGWGDFCKPVGENDFECH